MNVITPTVGRKVWYRPAYFPVGMISMDPDVPMDATIVYVWSDNMVNLHVIDHIGNTFPVTSVTLRQPGDPEMKGSNHCEWMPFQVGQAGRAIVSQ